MLCDVMSCHIVCVMSCIVAEQEVGHEEGNAGACDGGNLLRVQQLCRDVDASNIRYQNLFNNTPLHEAARYVLYSPYHLHLPSISLAPCHVARLCVTCVLVTRV